MIFDIQPGETGFDATLGYGGHTKAMMECLHGEGHMYATDVDPEESAKTRKRLAEQGFGEDILTVNFRISVQSMRSQKKPVVLILFGRSWRDLPCRSTIRSVVFLQGADGPLDLRLNQEKGISAAERLDNIF